MLWNSKDRDSQIVELLFKSQYAELVQRIQKKTMDLQDQLLGNAYGGNKLNENDILRYSAMIEVLKAVLQ